ncbi:MULTISPECIES: LysE family translocator [Staphylococcus]|uniref:LysE family translocator n=2 Tax=Staphylococcus TaxID=1279 RepID=UPI000619FB87|nr:MULTISPECIES: LysE family transporter [Staphylococcus]KKD24691.1 lysine transporter LysE [Staphylococcus cohnii subsp. cohnii]KKD25246.1 lysine transporter LysE [Staphylococcus cohnii subsp. cohnii]MDK7752893.1 LysE family transporter [Staphylococcus sp. UMB10092B]OFQ90081.1 lysine transporter LysE [Staphylococcus sp. HMSC065A08]OHO41625.1 lysine transporter LysE [Staphylococcus sp. HMSC034G07]
MNMITLIVYCFIVTATPGPTNIIILSNVQNYGIKSGMRFTYGSTIGFVVLLVISAILNSFLSKVLPNIIIYLQILGTIYMIHLAYQIFNMDVSKKDESKVKGSFFSGLLLQFINPKVILFTLTVFPSFILPYSSENYILLINIFIIGTIGFIAFMIWVGFGAIFNKIFQKYNKILNIVLGILLIYAAIMLWV